MSKPLLPGTFVAMKKDGTIYYRSTITHKSKHISLGSYETELDAHKAYVQAQALLDKKNNISIEEYDSSQILLFEKWVSLINFRDNNIYIKNPIYLKKGYFIYYLSESEFYYFDIDELFYYSEHKIMKRKGHLFVSDYGMQVTILSRYGIKNYARPGVDYRFINDNPFDLRAENIEIISSYTGVTRQDKNLKSVYLSKLHIRSNYVIGRYDTEIEAAIAYNKAVDIVKSNGCKKNFQTNYIEQLPASKYADIYQRIKISKKIYELSFS